jgi:hypothetical protein
MVMISLLTLRLHQLQSIWMPFARRGVVTILSSVRSVASTFEYVTDCVGLWKNNTLTNCQTSGALNEVNSLEAAKLHFTYYFTLLREVSSTNEGPIASHTSTQHHTLLRMLCSFILMVAISSTSTNTTLIKPRIESETFAVQLSVVVLSLIYFFYVRSQQFVLRIKLQFIVSNIFVVVRGNFTWKFFKRTRLQHLISFTASLLLQSS